jgi:bifunctional enzyme CysN/CysC
LTLEDEIDVSRGDMIARRHNLPLVEGNIDAIVCWMGNDPLKVGKNYFIKHTTRTINAYISELIYMFDVNTLHRTDATEHNLFCELLTTPHHTDVNTLMLNEIGRAQFKLTQPIMFDQYNKNRETGSFIIIDPDTNFTVGAGMIRGAVRSIEETIHAEETVKAEEELPIKVEMERDAIARPEREERYKHKTAVIWFTGLSGSGKSTIAKSLERLLFATGIHTALLDWDKLRHGLCKDLSFSDDEDRIENIRRVGEVASVFYEHGSVVLCTFISPLRCQRDQVKALIPEGRFLEVFVRCSLQTCIQRDPRGLYKKAIDGEIPQFTGINAPYEEPLNPDIILDTEHISIEDNLKAMLGLLKSRGIIRK